MVVAFGDVGTQMFDEVLTGGILYFELSLCVECIALNIGVPSILNPCSVSGMG